MVLPVEQAVALTGIVHFLNGVFKFALVGRHADVRVVLRFGLPAMAASFVGALLSTRLADLLPVAGLTIAPLQHIAGIAALLEKNEALFVSQPQAWAEARFDQVQRVNRESSWTRRAAEWEAFLAPAVASKRARP